MNRRLRILCALVIAATGVTTVSADTIPDGFCRMPELNVGVDVRPAFVPGTNSYLRGENDAAKAIDKSLAADVRFGFRFNKSTRQGMLYRGLYQGVGLGVNSFFNKALLGTPVSLYVYQGAPIAGFGSRLWLGYEWQFGAAFGWKHHKKGWPDNNVVAGTAVTAHMGLGLKLHYQVGERWELSLGVGATHFSNGNTASPNAGVNTVGLSLGVAYTINPQGEGSQASAQLAAEADRGRWFYDIMAFGAWRRLAVTVADTPQLCPGKFAVAGLQLAPMRRLNRYLAVGPALDVQWDESAGLGPYWVEGTYDDGIRFERPPFGRQISAGISAHAELTMPIFAINAGLGVDLLCPKGNRRFYQTLALKTFITDRIFLNVGYRLGNFKDPQNLMLGIGLRL